jgi:hypothetical protein
LFDALGELYDGQIAEGTYNVNSTEPAQHPEFTEVYNQDELNDGEATFPSFEESWAYHVEEDASSREHITIDDDDESVARTGQRMNKRAPTTIDNDGESVARTEQRMNKRAPTTTKKQGREGDEEAKEAESQRHRRKYGEVY